MSNEKQPPVHRADLITVARAVFLLSGVLTIVQGFVFIATELGTLGGCTGNNCIGPSLRWGGFIQVGLNAAWASVFTLAPNLFVNNFTPIIVGTLTTVAHIPGFNLHFTSGTWVRVFLWSLVQAVFANIGYAGNLGIIFACVSILSAILALFCALLGKPNDTSVHVKLCSCKSLSCFADNALFITVARIVSFGIGVVTVVIGILHVFLRSFDWCPSGSFTECIGPSLRWISNTDQFTADSNDLSAWRSVFTLVPDIAVPLWGPVIFGTITVLQHVQGHEWTSISQSWARTCLWFFFIAFFCNFGYTGGLGVITGFASIVEALLAFLIAISGGGQTSTHLSLAVAGGRHNTN